MRMGMRMKMSMMMREMIAIEMHNIYIYIYIVNNLQRTGKNFPPQKTPPLVHPSIRRFHASILPPKKNHHYHYIIERCLYSTPRHPVILESQNITQARISEHV